MKLRRPPHRGAREDSVTPLVIPDADSIKTFVDRPLGPTEWTTVSQKMIDLFAEATGDRQWIHVDPARAKRESPFGETIAHGYLTLSLAPILLAELMRVERVSLTLNSGIEKIRLQAPVPAGSRVRMRGMIKSVRETPGGAKRVTFHLVIEVEGARRPACVGDAILVYVPETDAA